MSQEEFLQIIETQGLSKDEILDVAFKTGLIERKRNIMPKDILYSFCYESINGETSYNIVASRMEEATGISVSKQAVQQKMTKQSKSFFQEILAIMIRNKIDKDELIHLKRKSKYKRILVQDSTIIKLPLRLFKLFSGVSNGKSKSTNARIQGIYDLLAEKFIYFSIDTYTKNDIKAASELELEDGDLVLRDRGYLDTNEIERHKKVGADCIYRSKFKLRILDQFTLKPLNLTKELKKNGNLDIMVRLNNKKKLLLD